MRIAIDFDNTYSAAPELWEEFIAIAQATGHDCRIVTARNELHDRTGALIALESSPGVIYTRGVAKKWHCSHFTGGWLPDVWVDDRPESVFENSPTTPEALAEWRATRPDGPHIEERRR